MEHVDCIFFNRKRGTCMSNEKLKAVVDQQIEQLANMEPGTEEHTRATNDLVKQLELLHKDDELQFEIDKFDYQDDEKVKDVARENEIRKEDNRRNWIQFGIGTAATIGTTLLTMAFWKNRYHEGLQFEKEGTYTAKGGAQSVMRNFPKIGK
jgi:hypothetical protein